MVINGPGSHGRCSMKSHFLMQMTSYFSHNSAAAAHESTTCYPRMGDATFPVGRYVCMYAAPLIIHDGS